jgi:phosphatidylinositol alpha-1,6-mannosyltransferase
MTTAARRFPRGDGRVLVVTNDFPPRRGGIESFVLSLCEGLEPEHLVVYTAAMPGSADVDERLPFPVVRDPRRMLVPTSSVSRRVRAAFRDFECDRVLFGAAAPLGLLARGLRRDGARRVVALTHGHEIWWGRVPVARRLLRRIGRDTDLLTYVSEYCRSAIAPALDGEAARRMVRLSPGVDAERFRPGLDGSLWRSQWGIRTDQRVVLAASRLVRRKGQDRLVEAWPTVAGACPDAVLVVLGDGRQAGSLRRRAARLGVAGSVRLVPGVTWDAMPSVYAAADVFALPCRTRRFGLEPEALGIVFLEAAASGLPVVAGRSGGAPEAVEDGWTGCVVDPSDPTEIAAQLVRLLDDADVRAVFGERGRTRVLEQFRQAATQERLRALLRVSAQVP